jgi:hypothetical protein
MITSKKPVKMGLTKDQRQHQGILAQEERR